MNRIRDLRQKMGWTQEDLASRLNITYQAVGHYETGRRAIDVATVLQLCDIFGCTADYLLGRSPIQSAQITPEEERLLRAYRQADSRARDMVDLALAPFMGNADSEPKAM